MNRPKLIVVTTTFAEQLQATEMARQVIRERAVACAQVEGPIESHYVWEGQLCQDTEWRLTMKTTASTLAQLTAIVQATHPYKLPQWVVVAVESSTAAYAEWVRDAVEKEGTSTT